MATNEELERARKAYESEPRMRSGSFTIKQNQIKKRRKKVESDKEG